MAIFNIFKKKGGRKKRVKVKEKPKEIIPEVKHQRVEERKIVAETYRILRAPQVTEKATNLAKRNQYVFKVSSVSAKRQIKKAIEDLYGIDVLSVKIVKIPAKRRRLGKIMGWRKGYKKAIVRIKEGQKIEVLPR